MNYTLNKSYWRPPVREELRRWFGERAPTLEPAYASAVELINLPNFPGRINLICHAVRDIFEILPDILDGKKRVRPGDILRPAKELASSWKQHPPTELNSDISSSDYVIRSELYTKTNSVVETARRIEDQSSKEQRFAEVLFHSLDRSKEDSIAPWIIKTFKEEYKYFIGWAHFRKMDSSAGFEAELTKHFKDFERAVHSLIGPYFSGKEELDGILQATNTRAN